MMLCPKCESSLMHEREQGELFLDVCRACGGVWLDRGELERLLADAAAAGARKSDVQTRVAAIPYGDYTGYDAWDGDGDHHSARHYDDTAGLSKKQAKKLAKKQRKRANGRRKKKSGFSDLLGEIFD